MLSNIIVPAIAAATLFNGVDAASRHRHMHKKDIVYAATEVEIETVYETVTVIAGEEQTAAAVAVAATSTASVQSFYAAAHPSAATTPTAAAAAAATTSTYAVVAEPTVASSQTTLATAVKSDAAVDVQKPTTTAQATTAVPTTYAVSTTSEAAATTSTKAASTSSSSSGSTGGKRGLAYNDATLVSTIISAASATFGWCYDWGFTNGGLTANLEYIPMLWGPTHYDSSWDTAAAAAVSDGVTALFSFNECDNAGQANLDAATAASYHTQYLGPYKGQIKIGAPSITSSESTGLGLSWLSEFMSACGSDCAVDFANLHWYGPGGEAGAQEFISYLVKANAQTGLPVWVTEFGVTSGDEEAFLTYALDQLDNNSTLSFVDNYAYFYLSTGYLMSSTSSLSSAGSIYASAS
ncbi:glycosyl hydrolase catalytic core-domain-containing protein [Truncatella angustata]|uniref:Glycosyl hydrolase catalytic core-domain-containing protein n=1 Tax=Truncatella angustata TaxID=152316 RepID=A0A9P8UR58_9PEZI|nr:glycosyl hydrolase catalytic core-domain-containing protein [Truncatella angustata]KAH6656738.1 glycosyl hydrolase catalytic core-domain-containing protein [Truncatella angustata]